MKREVSLKIAREPLQIPYPRDFDGQRSHPTNESEIFLTNQAVVLTDDEIGFVEDFLERLPYNQSLTKGAVIIDADDGLLDLDHDGLDRVEKDAGFACTRKAKGSGERSPMERVLILRELGYQGNPVAGLLSSSN